jgi:hypothetical protein
MKTVEELYPRKEKSMHKTALMLAAAAAFVATAPQLASAAPIIKGIAINPEASPAQNVTYYGRDYDDYYPRYRTYSYYPRYRYYRRYDYDTYYPRRSYYHRYYDRPYYRPYYRRYWY